jgi:hypothetical protein
MGYMQLVEWIESNPHTYDLVVRYGYRVDIFEYLSWDGVGAVDKVADYPILANLILVLMQHGIPN